MPPPNASALETMVEGLRSTPESPLPYQADVVVRSFLLERLDGDVIVYNSPGLTAAAPHIRDVGGAVRLLVNHAHEAMYGAPDLDVPVFVHERDRLDTAVSMPVAGVFTSRQLIDDDLEVIPTPGHTAGTTSYLWDSGSHRFLFTGDFIWIENGDWKAVVLGSASGRLPRQPGAGPRARLRHPRPLGRTRGGACFAHTDRGDMRTRISAIIARVAAGGDR